MPSSNPVRQQFGSWGAGLKAAGMTPKAPTISERCARARNAAKHIGRPLIRSEQVHHKNGDRADNRIENLELWSTSQPSGQRVEDKLTWAREFIRLYENPDLLTH